ncbi:MAG: prealbumin-like fold domain-containing protein, partial [Clostridia bacterium]
DEWEDWTASYDPSDTIELTGSERYVTVEVTNTPDEPEGSITIEKVDGEGDPVAGMVFTLNAEDQEERSATTDDDGVVQFTGLPLGVTYTIEEILTDDATTPEYDPSDQVTLEEDNADVTVTVVNEEEIEIIEEPEAEPEEEVEVEQDLPATGGPGALMAYFGAGLAILGFVLKRRNNKR